MPKLSSAMAADLVGKAAPDFEVELEDGSKKKLSAFLAEGQDSAESEKKNTRSRNFTKG